ncbi:MAG: XTP/dITP diphosphatase [Candidatus Helarchaeota archaeon]
MRIIFASSNKNKIREASGILAEYNIEIQPLIMECPEIQKDDIEDVAKFSVEFAFKKVQSQVIVEDSGLFIESLKGFPGPYSSYVYRTIGNDGILNLMRNQRNRQATFKSVIAYSDSEGSILTFIGETRGKISLEILKGDNGGWGFDPIFIPIEGNDKTYAEMGLKEKNKISHRKRSLEKFGNWFKEKRC